MAKKSESAQLNEALILNKITKEEYSNCIKFWTDYWVDNNQLKSYDIHSDTIISEKLYTNRANDVMADKLLGLR